MEVKCSCPVCDTYSCYSKQSHRCLNTYNDSIQSNIHSPIDLMKTTTIVDNKTCKDKGNEIKDDSVAYYEESDRLSENVSVIYYEDNSIDKLKDFQIIPNSRTTLCPSAAKLSAQIMNFPFNEYQSLGQHKNASQTNIAKLTSFDIFEKIKEVYKACSCKVCECIVGKSLTNQVCNCKPCDCEECNSKGRLTISNAFKALEVAPAQTDYQRLEKSFLNSFVSGDQELNESCKCKPCECHRCFRSVSIPCKCKQCRCVECESHYQGNYQKLVVAAVGNDNQSRQDCMCTPCHCAECNHRYGASSSLRHEVSTEILRHLGCHCNTCVSDSCTPEGLNACSCERSNQVMRKPVQRDSTDFDIHRSIVTHRKIGINKTKHDLIAMFAAVSKTYTGCNHTNQCCTCGECGCMYCNLKLAQSSADAVKSSTVSFDSLNTGREEHGKLKYEMSTPDHKVTRKSCLKTSLKKDNFHNINYTDQAKIKTNNYFSLDKNIFESKHNQALDSCTDNVCNGGTRIFKNCLSKEDEDIYPIKKGEKLAPFLFRRKINKPYIRFCDENNIDEEDYETPTKKARMSTESTGIIPVIKSCKNRRYSQMKYSNIESVNIKANPKVIEHVRIFTESHYKAIPHIFGKVTASNVTAKPLSDFSNMNSFDHDTNDINKLSNIKCSLENNILENSLHMDNKTVFEVCNVLSKKIINQLNDKSDLSSDNNIFETTSLYDKTNKTDTVADNINNMTTNEIEPKEEIVLTNNKTSQKYDMNEEMKKIISGDENYKTVEKTLKEARDFTQRLMELLNKYEKANQEFESIYYKIKKPNNRSTYIVQHMAADSNTETKKLENLDTEMHLDNYSSKKSSLIYGIYGDNLVRSKIVKKCENDTNMDLELSENIQDLPNEAKTEPKRAQSKENLENTSHSSETNNDAIIEFKQYSSNTFSVDSSILTDDVVKCKSSLNPIIEATVFQRSHLKYAEPRKRRRCRRYGQMYKQAVIASKRSKLIAPQIAKCSITTGISDDFFESLNENFKQNDINKECDNMKENTGSQKSEVGNTKDAANATKDDIILALANVNYNNSRSVSQSNKSTTQVNNDKIQFTEEVESQDVKYDSSNATDSEDILGVYRKTSLGKGIKEAVNVIKQASVSWQSKYLAASKSHRNEALSKLHLEVKKLLDLPLLQKCDIDVNESSRYQTGKDKTIHNCDALKVSFLSARQMSDRSLVVTWLAPKDLDNVQGYEVLVNGCFAQKIRDQTCCETVLSHLPRSDKILLTVRTLTKSKCLSGHNPSSTVSCKTDRPSKEQKDLEEKCSF